MPNETVDTENIDPQQGQSPPETTLTSITKLKGVSWQDGVDGKSLFTVSYKPLPLSCFTCKMMHGHSFLCIFNIEVALSTPET